MARVRRTVYLFFHGHDGRFLDIGLLLRGQAELTPVRQIHALSILRGEIYPIERDELDLLLSVPSDEWTDSGGLDPSAVDSLVGKGLLLSDGDGPELEALRRRDEGLASAQWNLYAALFHFMTKWRDVDLRAGLEAGELPSITTETIEEFVAVRGRPPGAFHSLPEPLAVHELPLVRRRGGLYTALAQRRTTRGFDRTRRMTLDDLAVVLYYVWGCHGTAPILGDIFALKRTSPSGGGLHPIEAYPIVTGVEGITPGLYHYRAKDHALELISQADEVEASALATEFVCGQDYFGSAHVSVVMTARFFRNHWKYGRHQKAYPAILMDAAHLSQTLYLVAAELGLGAYVTAAINSQNVEEVLGLDGCEEGAIAICGCGLRPSRRGPFEPSFTPYVPRETAL